MRVIVMVLGFALLKSPARAQTSPAVAAFDRLKSLVGEWEATGPDGEPVRVVYELVSGGTAVMERVMGGAEHGPAGMLSIFYLAGDRIGMSHFCSAGNQPRFVSSMLGETIRFELDGRSLTNPVEGHIHEARFRFGGGRVETEWVWFEQGGRDHSLIRRQARVQ